MKRNLYILSLCLFFPFFLQAQQAEEGVKKEKLLELEFSTKGGFYQEGILLEMRSPGARIYYTLDGTLPTRKSEVYKKPLFIEETTVVRAIARRAKKKSKQKGHTYFIGEPKSNFPIVSIAIPPEVLFDPELGLFMEGSHADSTWKKDGANFWSKKETKINCEIFEPDGKCAFRSMTGLRLFGGMSRLFPQKSVSIIARNRYGKKRIKHKIFGKGTPNKFKFLVLRNSGSDFSKTHFRDPFITSLLDDWDLETQDSRASHVYINGKYWGIYNIREKVNRYFLNTYHDIDKDSIDLIEHKISLKRGSKKHYLKMLEFMAKNDLSESQNFAYLQSQMDVENFMDYQIAQIYMDNQDAGGNIKFWRPQTEDGRWRWILYDTDWGFGLHSSYAYKFNSLEFHTAVDGPDWPNPPWSTFILRSLLENPSFQRAFVLRFMDRINETFEPTKVTATLDEFYNEYLPEMPRQFKRWRNSEKKWNRHIDRIREFAEKRPAYVRKFLQEKFKVGDMVDVSVDIKGGGKVLLNGIVEIKDNFKGKYFEKLPIQLKAVPNFGYRFSHWKGVDVNDEDVDITLELDEKVIKIKAVFEKSVHELAGQIMINEISSSGKDIGDWVEVFNDSKTDVNLENWVFSDKKKYFKLPSFNLRSGEYVVLCEDAEAFYQKFPDRNRVIGGLSFGLNKRKEVLGLYSNDGAAIDSVSYEIEPLDSIFTLGLLLPHLDNSDFENWEINMGEGTPDGPNPYYLESKIKVEQNLWMRIGIAIAVMLLCVLILVMKDQGRKAA